MTRSTCWAAWTVGCCNQRWPGPRVHSRGPGKGQVLVATRARAEQPPRSQALVLAQTLQERLPCRLGLGAHQRQKAFQFLFVSHVDPPGRVPPHPAPRGEEGAPARPGSTSRRSSPQKSLRRAPRAVSLKGPTSVLRRCSDCASTGLERAQPSDRGTIPSSSRVRSRTGFQLEVDVLRHLFMNRAPISTGHRSFFLILLS
jgi:hypothetical protein